MTIPSWPSELPQALLATGYGEEDVDLTIASKTDIGPAKVRLRSSSGPRPVNGQVRLTREQLRILLDFRMNELRGGALRFLWNDTIDPTQIVEMRFVTKPTWVIDRGKFLVTLSLEILP